MANQYVIRVVDSREFGYQENGIASTWFQGLFLSGNANLVHVILADFMTK